MSAAYLDRTWETENKVEILEAAPIRRFSRQVGPARTPVHCPECDSIIYSRRHRLCGVCSRPLPEELLFNIVEVRTVESLLATERERHRKWLEHRASRSI